MNEVPEGQTIDAAALLEAALGELCAAADAWALHGEHADPPASQLQRRLLDAAIAYTRARDQHELLALFRRR